MLLSWPCLWLASIIFWYQYPINIQGSDVYIFLKSTFRPVIWAETAKIGLDFGYTLIFIRFFTLFLKEKSNLWYSLISRIAKYFQNKNWLWDTNTFSTQFQKDCDWIYTFFYNLNTSLICPFCGRDSPLFMFYFQ